MRARYRVLITPADVGRRVSVRAATHAGPGQPSTTDAVGFLRRWADGVLVVERRDGTRTTIAESDLLAGKALPPGPDRTPGRTRA